MADESDPAVAENLEPEAEHDREAMPVDGEEAPRLAFPVVGIGASAGGLEAFTDLFKVMPADTGMAFVLVQHLPPQRESLIADILGRHTPMSVQQVENGTKVEPNHVYIIRPGYTLTIHDGHLHLGVSVQKPGHSRPIDDFFKSLAEEQRERAIAIIMSGMGSNGSAGAQAVKAVGGLCVAQDPESAQFPSMPRHLIDAGYADFVLPVAEMPEVLMEYVRHPYATDRAAANEALQIERKHVREILAILRTRTRHDFAGYKQPTVLRRIQRRMGLNRLTEIGEYARLLRRSPTEVSSLGDDLLIHVTGFFRDPEAWETLRQRVVVPLVESRQPHESIRCWVAACSSGEEAYSLTMLLVEESERVSKPLDIKVFATDTADRTLANARNGIYPGGIESDVTPERLARFFDRDAAMYRVRQDLRERVVFAPQNVLTDPPFSRLDIATCRNLLIYLQPEIQLRVISLLHFGLRQGGTLFLGTSETVPGPGGLFEAIDTKARIYRRIGTLPHGMNAIPPYVSGGGVADPRPAAHASAPPMSVAQLTARALLAQHVPVAVTVDRQLRVVYFQGKTSEYLRQPSGEPTQDITALANDELRGAVRLVLERAMATNATASASASGTSAHERRRVLITASPISTGAGPEFFVVSFQERDESGAGVFGNAEDEASVTGEQEVQRLRDELQSTIQELQASNEEHKAATEEAMSVNEELQSSNEELETSKEEMQSLNEELSTVNAQLHAKMAELQNTSSDLRSLLASTDIAVIFLDPQFRIRRYTPAARGLVELIGTDVGRPMQDLAMKFTDPDLLGDAQAVLERLVPIEKEIRGHDGRWYMRRVLPYRTADDRIGGVVITFVDISDRKRAEVLTAKVSEGIAGDLRVMDSLHVAASHLTTAKNMEAVLNEILVAAVEVHGSDRGTVHLYNAATSSLQLIVHRGLSAEVAEAWGRVDFLDAALPSVKALKGRTSVVVEDLERDIDAASFRQQWLDAGVRALVSTPLVTRGDELIGVLTLHFSQAHRPDERAMRITELLAQQAADTIERMRTEEELARLLSSEQLARQALDDAAQMKDQFLASLSHELRTPLSAILLWGKVLSRENVGAKEVKDGIAAIVRSGESQARLIDDLLDTSRIALGKVRLEMAEIELADVVASAVEQNMPAARAKGIAIETRVTGDIGTVIADPMRIRQVVWNITANAVKFTPANGHVVVTLARRGTNVTIEVSDTGVGIDPEFLPYVFDRFRQYDASITRKHGGLGLGLAIAKQLVELHGGMIRGASEGTDRGATFTVTLPLPALRRSTTKRPARAGATDHAALRDRTILLVEDEPATLEVVSRLLTEAGVKVTEATSATEAVASYAKAPPQLLLSDIGLSDMDGYALLGRIRQFEQDQQLATVPAVAFTAYARDEDRRKASAAGFVAHVAKPVDPDQLLGVLNKILGSA
jgi:two-component system, chemotaxis family, CheB/CheR fusion protein